MTVAMSASPCAYDLLIHLFVEPASYVKIWLSPILVIVVSVKLSIDIAWGLPEASCECVNAVFQSLEVPLLVVSVNVVALTLPTIFALPVTSKDSVGLTFPIPTEPLL